MDFWQIIRENVQRPLDVAEASRRLESALEAMPAGEIANFCQEFDRRMDEAYRWDLWGVAYIINGGCGDDAFMDFRASLIGLGEEIFTAAIADAETLAALDEASLEEMFAEGLLYCGPNAYEAVAGEPAVRETSSPDEPLGEAWQESSDELRVRFPTVWARFGREDAPDPTPDPAPGKPWWKFW